MTNHNCCDSSFQSTATPCRGRRIAGSMVSLLRMAFLGILLLASLGASQKLQGDALREARQNLDMKQVVQEWQTKQQQNPKDAHARFMLAWAVITSMGINPQAQDMLKSAFDPNQVDKPLHEQYPLKGFMGSMLAARYAKELRSSDDVQKFAKIAYNISVQMSPQKDIGEVCTTLMLATDLTFYPTTHQDVDDSLAKMEHWANYLIDLMENQKHPDAYVNNQWLSGVMPGFANDPYVHCVLTNFPLSFYYRADVARVSNLNYKLAALAFPRLLYTAKHVEVFDEEQKEMRQKLENGDDSSEENNKVIQKCVDRKIKLGVISATLSENHSVSEDFGGILQRLDRNKFEVSYHILHEQSRPDESASFLTANPQDKLYHYGKTDKDVGDAAWTRRFGDEIEKFEFDMILYLDLTMSTYVRRLGMERLAPVQLNTHGHPVTSGHPREIVQHFVSWAEAELPLEQSQTHYTEQLQLIPKGKIHQYYTPRLTTRESDGVRISRVTQMPVDSITRKDYPELSKELQESSPETDPNIHVYVCMQKPFKVFPEFDELLCGILQKDPLGQAILHKETQTGHTDKFVTRLKMAGCDMDRVHFVSPQPSHLLLALYKTATVILDSYPAGGCTTSREALELGKAIVTWPARLLGGRWTLGLYNIIGLGEDAKSKVIANSKDEYINKAVELANNHELRKDVEGQILEALPNLWRRPDAVEEWEKILLRVSPVKQCDADDNSGKDEL